MARPKAPQKERKCLVCGGITSVAHLGRDICRACIVFYRRSRNRSFACRARTNNCRISEGDNCRKCRLVELERMLSDREPNRPQIMNEKKLALDGKNPDDVSLSSPNEDVHTLFASASTSSSTEQGYNCDSDKIPSRELLERLRSSYRSLCETRLTGELTARKNPPHPLAAVDAEFEILPATYAGMDISHRVLLTSLLQFGNSAFTEATAFSSKDRWTLVKNFFTRYRTFEGEFRADQGFREDMTKTFAGFTSYYSTEVAEHFFDDIPHEEAFREEAKKAMRHEMGKMVEWREQMRAVNLRHEEFLAVLAMMYWDTDGTDVSTEVLHASKTIKDAILKDLHSFYRDEINLNDYASRLGELLMLLPIYEQRSSRLDKHFEMMRLLNVFTDNSLIYRLE